MAGRNLLATLLFIICLGFQHIRCQLFASNSSCQLKNTEMEQFQQTGRVCSSGAFADCVGHELSGNVLVTGTEKEQEWILSAGGDAALTFAAGANVTISCLSLLLDNGDNSSSPEVKLYPVELETLLSPPFFRPAEGALASLTVRDVEIWLGCKELLEWQHYLCGIRLPGMTKVQANRIDILLWRARNVHFERISFTCLAGSSFSLPACFMVNVEAVEDILEAVYSLQEPSLPLVLTVSRGLNFTDSNWPADGLRITANVTLSATIDSVVAISFGLKTVLFSVDSKSSSTAFLSFRGCILKDLPLSYLPLDHPRRPFGVLSTSLWPVYREEVAMGLYNCTLILTNEEFMFWSFWLSILISPIPSVRALGNWSYATGVQLKPSGSDYISLASYYGRYTTIVDVRYQISNEVYTTQQRKNILQITGNAQVPPTVVFQVRDSTDLLSALVEDSNPSAMQYGQYIILTQSVSMGNASDWPLEGAVIRYPTTLTTWPSSWVAFDLRLMRNCFSAVGNVLLKNLALLNLAAGHDGEEFFGMATGLWAFSLSNWRNADQQRLSLENIVLVVGDDEVNFYLAVTVDGVGKSNPWITSYQVESYDTVNRSWVYYSTLATLRFTSQKVNITSRVPEMFGHVPVTDASGPGVSFLGDTKSSSGGSERKEVLLFTLLAITLPTAFAASLLTFVIVRRRRLRQMCVSSCNEPDVKEAGQSDGNASAGEGEVDEEDCKASTRVEAPCCFNLPLTLRKSKFVNPLYDDRRGPPPEVVLTAVLGPSTHARLRGQLPLEFAALAAADGAPSGAVEAAGGQDHLVVTGPGARSSAHEQVAMRLRGSETSSEADEEAGDRPLSAFADAAALNVDPGRGPCLGGGAMALGSGGQGQEALQGAPLSLRDSDGGTGTGAAVPGAAAASSVWAAAAARSYGHTSGSICLRDASTQWCGSRVQGSDPASAGLRPSFSASRVGNVSADTEERQQQLLGRQMSGREAAAQGGGGGPAPLDMQRLDRLRRDIADRHLEVQHSLGWGGCGVVYKGTWKGLQVAVKTMLLQGDSRQSRQFLTEAAISASLQHANIVTTYLYELRPLGEVDPGIGSMEIRVHSRSSDESPGEGLERMSCWKLYIVQEYCELGTLKAAIDQGYFKGARSGVPNLAFVLTIALDVANGLMHVHSKNVVHGDVTVSNVLLQTHPGRPQGCVAKVADFGLSVKFETGQSHESHMYGGTPHYMAPERTRGMLSKESDIYSLGVCLWELYCGTPPWRRNAAGAHNRRYADSNGSSIDSGSYMQPYGGGSGDGDAYSDLPPGSDAFPFPRSCPSEYSSLVLACLAAEPQRRPTVERVVDTLQRLQRRYG